MPDPFDVAPRVARQTVASWILLGIGISSACGGGIVLWHALQEHSLAIEWRDEQRAQAEKLRRRAAERTARRNTPEAIARVRAAKQLEGMTRVPWTGLFDAIESAALDSKGLVSLDSVHPAVSKTGASINVKLTGTGSTDSALFGYVAALVRCPGIADVQFLTQTPIQGGEAIRFELDVVWQPEGTSRASRGVKDRSSAL